DQAISARPRESDLILAVFGVIVADDQTVVADAGRIALPAGCAPFLEAAHRPPHESSDELVAGGRGVSDGHTEVVDRLRVAAGARPECAEIDHSGGLGPGEGMGVRDVPGRVAVAAHDPLFAPRQRFAEAPAERAKVDHAARARPGERPRLVVPLAI